MSLGNLSVVEIVDEGRALQSVEHILTVAVRNELECVLTKIMFGFHYVILFKNNCLPIHPNIYKNTRLFQIANLVYDYECSSVSVIPWFQCYWISVEITLRTGDLLTNAN